MHRSIGADRADSILSIQLLKLILPIREQENRKFWFWLLANIAVQSLRSLLPRRGSQAFSGEMGGYFPAAVMICSPADAFTGSNDRAAIQNRDGQSIP
jgi:hypothetical protein